MSEYPLLLEVHPGKTDQHYRQKQDMDFRYEGLVTAKGGRSVTDREAWVTTILLQLLV